MIDHVGLRVKDYTRAKAFYGAVLAPLGYHLVMELGKDGPADYQGAGFGADGKPSFWISPGAPNGPVHLAFVAQDHRAVGAFHAAALIAGGKDNGPPGPRPQYHTHYYSAFIYDPDGNNVEAVCHRPL